MYQANEPKGLESALYIRIHRVHVLHKSIMMNQVYHWLEKQELRMTTKPRLNFWQIWNMSFGFFGIQIGWGLQNANVSRIFQSLGASIDEIPILWIAAPLTGLLIQPIVGYFSDHTWNRLGRRRPFFLGGAILATIALLAMPNSSALWMAAIMLWIMDASINITMEPFRAFVGDMLPDEQRTRGFAMQSFFIGTGAVISSAMPWVMTNWFGISNIAEAGFIPDSVRYSFYLGGGAYFISVIWTVISTKEYSPDELQAFDLARAETLHVDTTITGDRSPTQFFGSGRVWLFTGLLLTTLIFMLELEKELMRAAGKTHDYQEGVKAFLEKRTPEYKGE